MLVMAIQFRLTKIEVPQFAILTDKEFTDSMNINYGFEFSVSEDTTSLRCDATASYIDGDTPVMKIVVRCEFYIEQNCWNALKTKNGLTFPAGFLQHLASLTVGTMRGVYYEKTENTAYNRFFIPLLDVNLAIKEDLTFPINS